MSWIFTFVQLVCELDETEEQQLTPHGCETATSKIT